MPHANLRRFDLDHRALDYIVGTLDAGNVLSEALRGVLSKIPGETYTLAPTDTPIGRLYEFTTGGLLHENIERSRPDYLQVHANLVAVESLTDEEAEIIHAALLELPRGICVFDDVNPRWSELTDPGPAAFNIGEEVYHLATADTGADEIGDLVRLADALWHGIAAVCVDGLLLPATSATLTSCAETATLVSCTAYDAEGFVIWRRKD